MSTKSEILRIADNLLREKGFNAFSFSDISAELQIKNASIHYHFPSKTDLGVALIRMHRQKMLELKEKSANKHPLQKLEAFLSIYTRAKSENKICIVGSLCTDLYSVEPKIQEELKILIDEILLWVTSILREGKSAGDFHFKTTARTKALMVITNMLASVQLTRLTEEKDYYNIKHTLINELIQK